MSSLEERHLDAGGRRLRFLVGGQGPPLLLCHGFMGSAENFAAWFDVLTARRTVVVPDLPGCGASDPLPGRHTPAALAAALEPLLDALRLTRLDVGGLCLGVPVALALTRRHRAAVDRLVLHTPLLGPSTVRRRFRYQVRLMTAPGLYPAARAVSRSRLVSDLYKRLLVEGAGVDAAAAEANFRNQLRADDRALREWLLDGLRVEDVALVAARRARTLLLVAGDDRVVALEALRRIAADAPQVRLVVDDGAGHGWTADAVARQTAAIAAFLDGRASDQPAA